MYNIMIVTPDGTKIFGTKDSHPFWAGGKKFKYKIKIDNVVYYSKTKPTEEYFELDESGNYIIKNGLYVIWFGGNGYVKKSPPNPYWFEPI